jgi:hypothetical protein
MSVFVAVCDMSACVVSITGSVTGIFVPVTARADGVTCGLAGTETSCTADSVGLGEGSTIKVGSGRSGSGIHAVSKNSIPMMPAAACRLKITLIHHIRPKYAMQSGHLPRLLYADYRLAESGQSSAIIETVDSFEK